MTYLTLREAEHKKRHYP